MKTSQAERRSFKRIRTVHLSARLRPRGRLKRMCRHREAAVIDFNRQGIALCTEYRFRVGDKVEMQIDGASEHIRGIKGVVRYTRRDKGEYSLGIQFDPIQINTSRRGRKLIGISVKGQAHSNILDRLEDVILQQLA